MSLGGKFTGCTRRDILAGIALGLAAQLRPGRSTGTAYADRPTSVQPPRYWLNVIPAGGMDAIWTTDPKTRGELSGDVHLAFGPDQILERKGMRIGPHLERLAPFIDRFAIVNGVLVSSANHFTGMEQAARLRTRTTMRTPSVFEIIGAHRDSQALAAVTLNAGLRQGHTLSFFGSARAGSFGGGADVFTKLDVLPADECGELERAIARQVASVKRQGTLSAADTAALDNLAQVRALLRRLPSVPRFSSSPWHADALAGADDKMGLGPLLQRAIWLFEHDLAATVNLFAGGLHWDTHAQNDRRQGRWNPLLAGSLHRLVVELDRRTNRFGRLSDQVAIIVGSEIGRFPYLNSNLGKDHFPQVPLLFTGPGFRTGATFGATGSRLEAQSTSAATGAFRAGDERLRLDDIGATVLRVSGVNPDAYGVPGRDLRFLYRA